MVDRHSAVSGHECLFRMEGHPLFERHFLLHVNLFNTSYEGGFHESKNHQ